MEILRETNQEGSPLGDIDLYSGIDFDFDEEIIDIIADTLKDAGLYDERVLLSGHSVTTQESTTFRTCVFAQTFAEYRYHQEFGPTDPLQNAVDQALLDGGLAAISVYDGKQLERDTELSEKYHTPDSQDIGRLLVARFIIN